MKLLWNKSNYHQNLRILEFLSEQYAQMTDIIF